MNIMNQLKASKVQYYSQLLGYGIVLIMSFFTTFVMTQTIVFVPSNGDARNFVITATWDETSTCQGSAATILFNIQRNAPVADNVYPVKLEGFVPITNGFACPIVIPPAPTGYISFDPNATPDVPIDAGNLCVACSQNLGIWDLTNPFPNIVGGYDMSVTFTFPECGLISFSPCITYNDSVSGDTFTECIGEITFNIVTHAELTNVATGPICQGSIFTGTLPPPICTAQQGYCPICICPACSGFTAAITSCTACSGNTGGTCICYCPFCTGTAATACTMCSGMTAGTCDCCSSCPCNLCSGYTGCPPCTSCVACSGCTACGGTGPCGPQPSFFVIGTTIGGSVNLVDPTGGVFEFVPDATFFGTASFEYNAVSAWNPIIFCPALTAGLYEITYAQNPVANPAFITGCSGTGVAGSLVPFVTGGSGSYTFSQTGPVSCGSVVVNPDGSFSFLAPTGVATICTFDYAAVDNTPPNCVGTGIVTVIVNELPISVSATIETCVNQAIDGTLTATNGTPPYTFALVTGPTNGTFTPAGDFSTSGNFTYTPSIDFSGTDSFTFSVTDANGCVSDPDGTETIVVKPAPVAGSTAINGCVNTQVTGNLSSLVTGGTGALLFSQPPNPSCATVTIFADGTFNFTPTFGFTGNCCFNYSVTQGGCQATGPAQVCVNVGNGPIATGSQFNVCPSGSLTGNLNSNIISATPPVNFILISTFGGFMNSFNPTTGEYSFTTTISSGQAGFTFQVDDVFPCNSATQTVLITVHPKPTTVTGTLQACDNNPIVGNLNPLVSGETPFTFTGPLSQAGGTTVINQNGIFTFTPNLGATGGDFTYEVASSFGCTGSGTEIIIIHPAPVATGETITGCSQAKVSGSLVPLVTGGTPPYVSYQVAGVPVGGAATVSSTGAFSFTPNGSVSPASFEYQVTDSNGCTDTATITVGVNRGPTATTGHFTGCGNGVEGSLIGLVSGIAPFTFTAPVGATFNGTVTLLDSSNGTFVFVPAFPAPTQGSFNYQVTDSNDPACTSNPTPVFVNVVLGQQANPVSFTGCENQSFSGSLAPYVTGGIPPYSFAFSGPVPACASSIVILPDGEIMFTPALNFTGPCTFDYCVTDDIPCNSCSTVTVNVQPSPLATNSGPLTGCVNNPFSGDLNDFMASGTPPFSFTGGNEINGILNLLVTGPFTFTPASIGLASFDYSAVDFYGCQSNTGTISINAQESPTITGTSPLDVCDLTTVTGTVTAASSPAIMPLTFSIAPGSEVNGTATVTQTSPTTADFTFTPDVTDFPTPTVIGQVTIRVTASNGCYGDFPVTINIHQTPIAGNTGIGSCSPIFTGSLTGLVSGGVPPYIFSQFNGFSPSGCGDVIIFPAGNYIFAAGGTGPCTFFYQVTDSSGSACSNTGAVTITTSIPPVVQDLITCACFNVPVSINLNTLTTGGVPPYIFAIVGTPIGGTVVLNPLTGIATFVPTPGFNGVGSFQFQAFDSFNPPCASNIGTVTIPVPCC